MSNPLEHPRVRSLCTFLENSWTLAAFGLFWLAVSALGSGLGPDEGMWGYQGWLWVRHHLPPYIGSVENKTPGIYYLYALSEFFFGHQYAFPRFIGIVFVMAGSFLIYRLATRWKDEKTGQVAMAVYLLTNAWASFDGDRPAFPETFMNFFTILAFYWVSAFSEKDSQDFRKISIAGFFLGWAVAFKQVAIPSAAALYIFLILRNNREIRLSVLAKPFLALVMGMSVATLISIVPLWISGVSFLQYIQGAWLILLHSGDIGHFQGNYVTWAMRMQYLPRALYRVDTTIYLLCFAYFASQRKAFEKNAVPITALLIWMLFDLAGAHASGKLFNHHFKQLLPSLSLAFAITFRSLIEKLPIQNSWTKHVVDVFALWLLMVGMVITSEMPPIAKSWRRVIRPTPSQDQMLGSWLNTHTRENEFVELYGATSGSEYYSNPVLYYSKRRASSRYFDDYFIYGDAVTEVLHDLTVAHPPRYILLRDNRAPDWLWSVINGPFRYRFNQAGFWVYERIK